MMTTPPASACVSQCRRPVNAPISSSHTGKPKKAAELASGRLYVIETNNMTPICLFYVPEKALN
jgi:hypothetical protein